MQEVLLVVHMMLALAIVITVLLQRSEGGGLGIGGGGGGGGFMTGRSAANLLTRTTAVLAAAFMATSITLTIMAGAGKAPSSILDAGSAATTPGAPANQDSGPKGPSVPTND